MSPLHPHRNRDTKKRLAGFHILPLTRIHIFAAHPLVVSVFPHFAAKRYSPHTNAEAQCLRPTGLLRCTPAPLVLLSWPDMHTGARIPRDKSTELHSSYLVFVLDVGLIGSHLSFSIFRQPAAAGGVHSVLFFSYPKRNGRTESVRSLTSSSPFLPAWTQEGDGMRAQKYHFQSSEQTLLLFFSVSRHIASAFGRCMPSLFDKTTGKSLPTTGCIQKKRICNRDLPL